MKITEIEFTGNDGHKYILEVHNSKEAGISFEIYDPKSDTYLDKSNNGIFTHIFTGERMMVTHYREFDTNVIKYVITYYEPKTIRGQVVI